MQAWVFVAQEDSERAREYYTFALLYALPLLTNGFHQDAFSIAAVLACAAHVQVALPFTPVGCNSRQDPSAYQQ